MFHLDMLHGLPINRLAAAMPPGAARPRATLHPSLPGFDDAEILQHFVGPQLLVRYYIVK